MKNIDEWLLQQPDARVYRDDPRIQTAARKMLLVTYGPGDFAARGLGKDETSPKDFERYGVPIVADAIWLTLQERIEHLMDDLDWHLDPKFADYVPALVERAAQTRPSNVVAQILPNGSEWIAVGYDYGTTANFQAGYGKTPDEAVSDFYARVSPAMPVEATT